MRYKYQYVSVFLLVIGIFLLLFLVVLYPEPSNVNKNKPSFTLLELEDIFLSENETTKLNFIILNPLPITFKGSVKIIIGSCIEDVEDVNIEIYNDYEKPYSVELKIRENPLETCLTRGSMMVELVDISGKVLDLKEINFYFLEEKK